MSRASGLALKRPRATLLAWLAVAIVLGLLGTGMQGRLRQSTLDIPGTPSKAAQNLLAERFGNSVTIPVLLTGPPAEVRRQGDRLVAVLGRRPATRVLSPFEAGAESLRPRPGAAMVVVAVDRPLDEALDRVAPAVRGTVDRTVHPPVRAAVTGMPVIASDLKQASFDSVARGERIAVVVLVIVLLLVFGTPASALVPAGFGVATVLSGFGLVWLLTHAVSLDIVAGTLTSMMGLALGVDYSLLLVSRFREELAGTGEPVAAARTAADTAGRTVLFAGSALAVAMVVATVLAPGDLLLSAAVGVLVTTLLAMVAALTAVPALLAVLGHRIERFPVLPHRDGRGVAGLASTLLRRPGLVAAALALGLLVLASPATALRTGPPDVGQLPSDSRAARDFQTVRHVMGPGWASAFEVAVATSRGAITDPDRLRGLDHWQDTVARDHDVALVIGPGDLRRDLSGLSNARHDLAQAAADSRRGQRGAQRLQHGLARAASGVGQLRQGLGRAARGASALANGSATGADGASKISDALTQASAGARKLRAGLSEARQGTARLSAGAARAAAGEQRLARGLATMQHRVAASAPAAQRLADGLRSGADDLGRLHGPAATTEGQLQEALRNLKAMTVGKADPRYVQSLTAVAKASAAATGKDPITGSKLDSRYNGLTAAIDTASDGVRQAANGAGALARGTARLAAALDRAHRGAARLATGLGRLDDGARRLEDGLAKLTSGSGQLAGGLGTLDQGAGRLTAGLRRLDGGAARLAGRLRSGTGRTAQLGSGLQRAETGSRRFAQGLETGPAKRVRLIDQRAPGLFSSGYLPLAALDGAHRAQRTAATFAVNLDRGGTAGRILVIPKDPPNTPGTNQLRDRLQASADHLAKTTGMSTGVAGPAALLADYASATSASLITLITALAILSYLLLLIIVRSVVLAAIAVALNLLTVGVCFGVLTLLFQGGAPLGGPGYIDSIAIAVIYTVIFGLSIDYEVFLISRMREAWLVDQDDTAAITYGLDRTARVVTGAAAIMVGVFAAFATAPVINVRQFGVGLAVAVTLDASVIRLGLLPALMRLSGRWCWWMPTWLDRLLPNLDPEAAPSARPHPAPRSIAAAADS